MKRKINKSGPSTLIVSLPSKWVKKQNIKQGDEVDVIEEGSRLVIGSNPKKKVLDISVDVSGSGGMLPRIIAGIYKAGFDVVKIRYTGAKELDAIQDIVYRSCHSYEIMGVNKNIVDVKAISELDPSLFNKILRKASQAVLTISDEVYCAVKKEDYAELSNLVLKDQIVDRHTDFCRRVINKGYDVGYPLIGPIYVILEQIEVAADILKKLSSDAARHKLVLDDNLLKLFRDANNLIKLLFECLFDFKMEKFKELGSCEVRIRKQVYDLSGSTKGDIKALLHLVNLFETVFEMKSALISLNADKLTTES